MQSILRNAVLVAGALLLGVSGAARAGVTDVLHANVPFAFVVNGQTLPAGRYTIQRDDLFSTVLLIRGEGDNHSAVFVSSDPDGGHDPAGSKPVLTFQRHENEYRLATVWASGDQGWDVAGRTLPALGFAQASSSAPQRTAASSPSSKVKPTTAKSTMHATTGVVRSIDNDTLVIARAGKGQETTFLLNPSTERSGEIKVGSTVGVRYRKEAAQKIATAVTVEHGKESRR
jgi:hypothetical protein